MPVQLTSKVVKSGETFATSVGGDLVLFDSERGSYYGSGIVGEKIWSLVADERSVLDICDSLMDQFDVDRQTCEAQVLEFLSKLNELKLVKVT